MSFSLGFGTSFWAVHFPESACSVPSAAVGLASSTASLPAAAAAAAASLSLIFNAKASLKLSANDILSSTGFVPSGILDKEEQDFSLSRAAVKDSLVWFMTISVGASSFKTMPGDLEDCIVRSMEGLTGGTFGKSQEMDSPSPLSAAKDFSHGCSNEALSGSFPLSSKEDTLESPEESPPSEISMDGSGFLAGEIGSSGLFKVILVGLEEELTRESLPTEMLVFEVMTSCEL